MARDLVCWTILSYKGSSLKKLGICTNWWICFAHNLQLNLFSTVQTRRQKDCKNILKLPFATINYGTFLLEMNLRLKDCIINETVSSTDYLQKEKSEVIILFHPLP